MEIWIVGATGRIGRSVAGLLTGRGITPTLVGRRRAGLDALRADLGLPAGSVVVADGAGEVAAVLGERGPVVVINLLGDYAHTAPGLARAVRPGGHHLDLATDLTSVPQLLGMHDEALAAGSTFVTGAGFGVLATEAVVAALCADRPAPAHVRVDALASVAMEAGAVGDAFAHSVIDALRGGGVTYVGGRLVAGPLGAEPQTLTPPDGEAVGSAVMPTAELVAAQRASGAPSVVAASGLAPTSPLVRAALPVARSLLSIPALRRFVVGRLAAVRTTATRRPRPHSWGHAVVTWPDDTVREGWLRADDGMDYTAAVAAEVAGRLADGDGRPGAYTPAAAFGYDIAERAGGTLLLG